MERQLGKIVRANFGRGGYQDAQIGLHLEFGGKGWGVCWSNCCWDYDITPGNGHKWTEEDRSKDVVGIVRSLSETLLLAKVASVDKLVGTPVEVEFSGGILKTWRVLSEVI